MLAVIIPTLNARDSLEVLLPQLEREGAALPIIISDGGSDDGTLEYAAGKKTMTAVGSCGRGAQLARGAQWAARTQDPQWYLFLHADSRLGPDWDLAVTLHMHKYPSSAGYFRFRAHAKGWKPRLMEFCVRFRELTFGGPYGDQGLLIPRALYEACGGYAPIPLFEDVMLIDAVKSKGDLRRLSANLYTDVSAYERCGYWARTQRNLGLLRAFRRGEDLQRLHKAYQEPCE